MLKRRLVQSLLVAATLVAQASGSAGGQAVNYVAPLSASETVPPVSSAARGTFTLSWDPSTSSGRYTASVSPITQATIGHIHLGGPGQAGPAVVLLFMLDPPLNSVDMSGPLTASDLVGPHSGDPSAFSEALRTGNLYVNIHTVANPAEEIRGQLVPAPAAAQAQATSTAPAPRAPATGSGGVTERDRSGTWMRLVLGAAALAVVVGARSLVDRRNRTGSR